jgi:transcriptional regulator with XRE-family HTH domain
MFKMLPVKTIDEMKSALARSLRERRLAEGFTQDKMATHCGCSRATYSSLETRGEGSIETLIGALHGLGAAQFLFDSLTVQGAPPRRRRVRTSATKGEEW